MDINKSISEFILEEVIPAAQNPYNKFALGVIASVSGTFGIGKVGELAKDMDIAMLAEAIRGGFSAQPTVPIKMSYFINEETFKKYPILELKIIKDVLETPYDIDKESAEKFIEKLKK
jgi:hypothetical protein